MAQLRPYQVNIIQKTSKSLAKYRRVIMCLPTGGGKTICFSEISRRAELKKHKILILSSRTEILRQNAKSVQSVGLNVEFIVPQTRNVPSKSNVAVAMAQTLRARITKPEWQEYVKTVTMIIIDECHENTANYIFDYLSESCYVIGVTATPVRYGTQPQLFEFYKHIVTEISIKELIELGFLSPARHFTFTAPKLDDAVFNAHDGDFQHKYLARKFEQKEQYAGVVENYIKICNGEKTIVYCVSSKQAIAITKEFVDNGIAAKYILSGENEEDKTLSAERTQLIADFIDNKFKVLVNVGILVAGFDCPDVQAVIVAFATQSVTKWLQALGRGARIAPLKKYFKVLDFGDNIKRLGLYDQDREWSLFHSRRIGAGVPPMKECPKDKGGCSEMIPVQAMVCPFCGYKYPTQKEIYKVELEEILDGETNELRMSVEQWTAYQALKYYIKQKPINNRKILMDVIVKNKGNSRKAFNEACKVLRNADGSPIDPGLYFVLKNILKRYKLYGK